MKGHENTMRHPSRQKEDADEDKVKKSICVSEQEGGPGQPQ